MKPLVRPAASLALCLAVGVITCLWSSRTPAPMGVEATPASFSAARAMIDDRVIAARPHPEGSPAALKARDYIFGRMTALGLKPRRTTGEAVEVVPRYRGRFASGGVVENLIGVLPGTDPAAPAIVLMAHSDSVAGSPGAADDAAGVVSALETVRALKAMGPHQRDVIVLITDGEEAGLLGARAFFTSRDPLLKHIGLVLNMEARGGGGRVSMFETGAENGAAMALFARTVRNTDSLSLMSGVYKYMPNSTDFTVVKSFGCAGYNFAFLGRAFDYHSPSSSPAALDQGSVQHMGDQVLALSKALADASVLPGHSPDAIYGDVLGGPVISYSPFVGWALLALSAVLAAAGAVVGARRSGEGLSVSGVAQGFGAGLFTLLATALVLHLAGRCIDGDWVRSRVLLANFGWLFAGMSALAGGVVLLAWRAVFAGWRRGLIAAGMSAVGGLICTGGFNPATMGLAVLTAALGFICAGKPLSLWSGWLGALILGLLFTLVLMIVGPPLAVATAWPVLIGAAAIAALGLSRRGGTAIALIAGLLVSAHLGHLAAPIFTAVGPDMPETLALLPFLGAFVLYPWLLRWGEARWTGLASGLLTGVGVLLLAVAAARDPASVQTPRPVQAFYLDDKAAGKAWRASALPRLDPWSRAALGGEPTRAALTPVFDTLWRVPAPAADLARPAFQSSAKAVLTGEAVTVVITPRAGGREIRLYLQSTTPLADVAMNGRSTELQPGPGAWVQLRWVGAVTPLVLTFVAKAPGALDLRYQEIAEGWPRGLAPPPKPMTDMPWGPSDDTVLVDRFQPRW